MRRAINFSKSLAIEILEKFTKNFSQVLTSLMGSHDVCVLTPAGYIRLTFLEYPDSTVNVDLDIYSL